MLIGDVLNKIKSITGAIEIGKVGHLSRQLPLYFVKVGKGKKVFLSSGVHGDEPAGVYATIEFFEKHAKHYLSEYEFHAVPLVNPTGFSNYLSGIDSMPENFTRQDFYDVTRGNNLRQNLNREFKAGSSAKESNLIMRCLDEYLFTMDLHETWPNASKIGSNEPIGQDPTEFYLWENCKDHSRRIGKKILEAVRRNGHQVCEWAKIYEDNNNGGVIWYPEDCGSQCYGPEGGTLDYYLASHHTPQAFTIETPLENSRRSRVNAHLTSFITALDHYR